MASERESVQNKDQQTQVSPFDTDVIDTTHLWLIWVIFKEGDLEALKTLDTFGNCKR